MTTEKVNTKLEVPAMTRSVSNEEKVELNVLLKFIKPFDGSRDTLNPFISNCQNAYNLADKFQKPILFKYILSQLIGRAEITCSIKEFDSFEQFIEFLTQQFGERKHYTHLLSELQGCKQNNNETVNQFALRIETCLAKLLTEIKISIPTKKKAEVAGRVAGMEDLALHTFMIGLHPRLSQIIRCRNPDTLNSAVNFAVAEEKILSGIVNRPPQPSHNNNYNDKNKFTYRRDPQFHSNRNPTVSRQPRNDSNSNLTCRYCKNVGHTIENCRKRQYNNNKYNNNPNPPTSRPQSFNTSPNPGPSKVNTVTQRYYDDGVDKVDTHLNE